LITVFGKNGKTRAIALPGPVWSEPISLRGSAGAEDPVFPSRSGKPQDRGRVRAILRKAAESVGVSVAVYLIGSGTPHASHALEHGAPIRLVHATLGHSSVATTSAYLYAPTRRLPRPLSVTWLKVGQTSMRQERELRE
jgi:integrase/recombinase XerD